MKRRGQSTLPCHGCGSTLPHWTGQVCDECAKALREHKAYKEQEAADTDTVLMTGKQQDYALPHIRHESHDSSIRKPLHALMLKLSMPASWPHPKPVGRVFTPLLNTSGHISEWDTTVRIRPDHAQLLDEILQAAIKLSEHAYAEGHRDGKSLLAQLASGEITADEFNDTALRREGG